MKPVKETDKSKMLKALGVVNDCPVAKKCGSCSYAGKSYFEQAAAKEKQVTKLLSPFCEVLPIHHCDSPFFYRNKVHSAFKRLKNGRVICGPYESGSHRIVETDSCLIENKIATAISVNTFFIVMDIVCLKVGIILYICNPNTDKDEHPYQERPSQGHKDKHTD